MNQELQYYLIVAVLISIMMASILFIMMFFYLKRSQTRYSDLEKRVILSELRESSEKKIRDIVMDLSATPDRWLDANHLIVSGQNRIEPSITSEEIVSNKFLKSMGLVYSDLKVQDDLVFVITPFSEDDLGIFTKIRDICLDNGFRCMRGDEDRVDTDILPHIVKLIVKSRIIIANISSKNANVMYELGISHALSKQTIIISKSINDVPFDIKGRNIFIYKDENSLINKIKNAIIRTKFEKSEIK